MPKGNEPTTKFKVDISELKAGIKEANKNIKLANAEFKAAAAGMDNWRKSSDGISAKLKQLGTVLTSQKSKLEAYKKQQATIDDAYEKNGKRADELRAAMKQLADQGVSKTSKEYKELEKALTEVEKEQASNKAASDQLKVTILNQEAAVNKTEKEIREYEKALSDLESESKKTESASEKLSNTISDQQSELDRLKEKYKDVVLEEGKNSDSAKELASEIDKLSNELKDNKTAMNNAEKAADELDNSLDDVEDSSEDAGKGFTVMKGALANLVADGIRMAIDGLKELAKETIQVGKEFDSSMAQVAAVSGASGKELLALRDKAKEMGASTKFSASEAADAFNYMAMAGWKTEDMLDGIDGILSLAAASNTDLATTSDIVTDALTAMGYSAGDAGRLADVMAAASSNANTNVEMMGATFKYAAPVVGALGYSMEDTAVAIGLMANSGIKAEQAGTTLRSMLSRLAAPPKEAATAMDALGISITDSDGKMKSLDTIMRELQDKFKGLSETQQTQYAKQIAGTEAMSGFLAIVNAAPADMDKLTNAVANSSGAAKEMSEIMQNNLGGDLTELGSKLEGVQISIYEKFEPALRKGVEILSKLLDVVNFVVAHSTEFTTALAAMATAIGVYVAYTTAINVMKNGWMSLVIVQKLVAAAQWLINAAMSANPIGIVIALIAGLVTAFVILWKKSDKFREFWINLWDKVKTFTGNAITAIVNFFKQLPGKIQTFLTQAIEKVKSWASNMVKKAKETGKNFLNNIVNFFKNLPYKIGYFIGNALGKTIVWSANMIKKAKETGKNFINGAINFIKTLPSRIWTFLTQTIAKAKVWASNMGKKGTEGAKKLGDSVINGLKSLPSKLLSVGKNIVQGLWKGISNSLGWIKNKVGSFAKGILDGMKSALGIHSPSTVFRDQVGKQIVAGISVGIKKEMPATINSVENLTKSMLSAVQKNLKNNNFEAVGKSVVTSISGSIDAKAKTSVQSIKNLINKQIDSYSTTMDKKIKELNTRLTNETAKINANKKLSSATKKAQIQKLKSEINAEIEVLKKGKTAYKKAGEASITAYTNAINDYASKAKSAVSNVLNGISEKFQEKYDALVDSQKDLQSKLSEFGELYTVDDTGKMTLNNLKEQTKAITNYANSLKTIKGKVSSDLFDEISQMSIEDGAKYMDQLLAMSDKDLAQYNKLYTQKIKASKSLSKSVYANDISSLKTEYNKAVKDALGGVDKTLKNLGINAMKGFSSGMLSQTKNMASDIKKIANDIIKQFKTALKIHSPSKVFAELGEFSAEGYEIGFSDSIKDIKKSIASILPNSIPNNTSKTNVSNVTNNFYQTNNSPQPLSRLEVYRQTKNLLKLRGT